MANYRLSRSIKSHTNRPVAWRHPLRHIVAAPTSKSFVEVACPSCHTNAPKALQVADQWGFSLAYCKRCYGKKQFQQTLAREVGLYYQNHGIPTVRSGNWVEARAKKELPCYVTLRKHISKLFPNTGTGEMFRLCYAQYV